MGDSETKDPERASVLCIAYHNMGVELEYLKRVRLSFCNLSTQKRYKRIKKQSTLPNQTFIESMNWLKIWNKF